MDSKSLGPDSDVENLTLPTKTSDVRSDFCVRRGIPVLALVNAILMVIPSSFLLHDALKSSDSSSYSFLNINVTATTILAIFVAGFQAFTSIVILLYRNHEMKNWCMCHIVIAAVLAVLSIYAFCNNMQRTYTGFTFTYTCVLDSIFSLGMSILLMLPD